MEKDFMASFSSEDILVLVGAFNRAWDNFVRTGEINSQNLVASQAEIARSICHHASEGVRDERRLAQQALAELNQRHGFSGC